MPFSPKSPLSKGPLCHLIWIFVYSLAILAINCHFCHFRQIRHFRQNRHFAKGPFAISFEFLFIVWRFWRLIAISAIFANACISGHISGTQVLGFGIRNTAQGIRNCNLESKFHCERIRNSVTGIRNPRRGFQNPSLYWISLHEAIPSVVVNVASMTVENCCLSVNFG